MALFVFNEPDQPRALKFPGDVGTKWGGALSQDGIPFDFTGWTVTFTLGAVSGPATMTTDVSIPDSTVFIEIPKAVAIANSNRSCKFSLKAESGLFGFVFAYGTIFFDPHPHL